MNELVIFNSIFTYFGVMPDPKKRLIELIHSLDRRNYRYCLLHHG
ncbi:hypothetical protein [Polynucleobacter sp. 71A-WALBACH]|nr:hypothetical protein [Polynucleobacter sp. 71A-WALBACH]